MRKNEGGGRKSKWVKRDFSFIDKINNCLSELVRILILQER